jgi:hypothetical protein
MVASLIVIVAVVLGGRKTLPAPKARDVALALARVGRLRLESAYCSRSATVNGVA